MGEGKGEVWGLLEIVDKGDGVLEGKLWISGVMENKDRGLGVPGWSCYYALQEEPSRELRRVVTDCYGWLYRIIVCRNAIWGIDQS